MHTLARSNRALRGRWAAGALCLLVAGAAFAGKTQNVVLIVSDGLRWQEVFTGAEEDLLNDKAGGSWLSDEDLRKRYWRASAAERRAAAVSLPVGNGREARPDIRQSGAWAAWRRSPTARRFPIRATTR